GATDQTNRLSLAVLVDPLELPDHDEGGEDLDQGIEAEAGQCYGMGRERGHNDDCRAHNVPAQGDVLESETPSQEPRVDLHRDSSVCLHQIARLPLPLPE